jgi:hypothetical protein
MKRLPPLRLALALAAIVTAFVTDAAQAKVVASGSGTSFASASGSAKSPKRIIVQVDDSTAFGQTVDVSWGVACTAPGFKFGSKDGTFVSTTRVYRRLPIPIKRPRKCQVTASASQSDFFVQPFVIYLKITAKR